MFGYDTKGLLVTLDTREAFGQKNGKFGSSVG